MNSLKHCNVHVRSEQSVVDHFYKKKKILNLWQTSSLFQWLLKHQGSSVQPDDLF